MDKSFVVSAKFNNAQIYNSELLANYAYSDFSGASVINSRFNPQGFMGATLIDTKVENCQPGNEIDVNPKPADERIQALEIDLARERSSQENEQDKELLRDIDH